MRKINLLLSVLSISFAIKSAIAATADIEKCDSFTRRNGIEKLTPINQAAKDVPATNSNRKSIDTLVQKHLENAVKKFNDSLATPENIIKYSGQCRQINGARVRGQITNLEKDFAEILYKEMTPNDYLTSLHDEIFTNSISSEQYQSQTTNIYAIQDKNVIKAVVSSASLKDEAEKTLVFLVERNERSDIASVNPKSKTTNRKYVICGDKLTSFFRHGYSLYRQSSIGDESTARLAINRNQSGERGLNKVDIYYSKAAAEFSGTLFYRDLLHPKRGLVTCTEKGLQVSDKRKFELAQYANSMWDESLNCTDFNAKESVKMNTSITMALKSSQKPITNCPITGVQPASVLIHSHCEQSLEEKASRIDRICSTLVNPAVGSNSTNQQNIIKQNIQQESAH